MIEQTVSKFVQMEAYGSESFPDQVGFIPPSGPVTQHPDSDGSCTPGLLFWASGELPAEAFAGYLLAFYNASFDVDGGEVLFDINAGLRIIDPSRLYLGQLGSHPGITGVVNVDWGDGQSTNGLELPYAGSPVPHEYASSGTFTVTTAINLYSNGAALAPAQTSVSREVSVIV